MKLRPWLDRGELQKVEVTEKSLQDILNIITRDLKDCQLTELSDDRRFATAYGAALNIANYVIRKKGYRVSAKIGHHKVTLEVAEIILGNDASMLLNFFDFCRRKRNKVDYDQAEVVTTTEVDELIKNVLAFKTLALNK